MNLSQPPQGVFFNKQIPPAKSLNNTNENINRKVEYFQRSDKANKFHTRLTDFELKLKARKRKFNFSLRESIAKLAEQEKQVEEELETLTKKMQDYKTEKENADERIQNEKLNIIKLQDEKDRLKKTERWADTQFSVYDQNFQSTARDSIFNTINDILQIKEKSRLLRENIFLYQKHIFKLFDDIAPVRTKIHLLNSRIEAEKDNKVENSDLSMRAQMAIQSAVKAQHLSIEKLKVKKHIDEIGNRLDEIKNEKNKILKKLGSIKSYEKEKILNTILEQINQYEEASQRRKNYLDNKSLTVHDAISKELELKIEIDGIHEELSEVNKQKDSLKASLADKRKEIDSLNQVLLSSDMRDMNIEDPLNDLINQIKMKREEEKQIALIQPREFEIDQEEIEDAKEQYENDYNDLKHILERELKFNQQIKKEIQKKTEEISQNSSKIEEPQVAPIQETTKMISLKKTIKDLEDQYNTALTKTDKIKAKIQKKQTKFNDDIEKLDLPNNRWLFRTTIAEQIERSMGWFLKRIHSQSKELFSPDVNFSQLLNQWDTKTISAILNEAEEFSTKSSLLNLH